MSSPSPLTLCVVYGVNVVISVEREGEPETNCFSLIILSCMASRSLVIAGDILPEKVRFLLWCRPEFKRTRQRKYNALSREFIE